MADWFDELTQALANDRLSRRQALRKIVGTVGGAIVAMLLPGQAFAERSKAQLCGYAGTCSTDFNNCGTQHNPFCYCFQRIDGKHVCCCTNYCASVKPCSKQSDCGKGYSCITNWGCGCSTGGCLQNCTKTCHLDAHRAGRTATGG